ncbi:MAG: hypothetical protein ACPGRX_02550 [Bdellovibrionales bacterium]
MRVLFLVIVCVGLGALGACGIKPGEVDPPSGRDHTTFPRTYPAAETLD